MSTNNRKQPLWPLFLLATVLGVFGFAMAFTPSDATEFDATVESPGQLNLSAPPTNPFSVEFAPKPQAADVWLIQTVTSGETKTETKMSFVATDTVEGDTVIRTLSDARVDLSPEETRSEFEVARLLDTLRFELKYDEKGTLISQRVSSAEAGQLARVVESIETATWLLQPNFPAKDLEAGARWSATRPEATGSTPGKLAVEREAIGADDGRAWIRQTVRQKIETPKPSANISGFGMTVVDAKSGAALESQIAVQTTFAESPTVFTSQWTWKRK